jgi:hypothetical protein
MSIQREKDAIIHSGPLLTSTIRISPILQVKEKMLRSSGFSRMEFISISKRDSQEAMMLLLRQSQLTHKTNNNLSVYLLLLVNSRLLKTRKYSSIQ